MDDGLVVVLPSVFEVNFVVSVSVVLPRNIYIVAVYCDIRVLRNIGVVG